MLSSKIKIVPEFCMIKEQNQRDVRFYIIENKKAQNTFRCLHYGISELG